MDEQMGVFTRRMFMMLGGAATFGVNGLGSIAEAAPMSEADKQNIEVVKAMSAAWKTRDAEKVASYMHDKVSFRGGADNMDAPAIVGKDKFLASIKGFMGMTSIDMRVLDAFALSPVVVTCHHQLFENKERGLHEDLYIGCFFIQDGKIREWNDYAIIRYSQPRQKDTPSRGKFIHTTMG